MARAVSRVIFPPSPSELQLVLLSSTRAAELPCWSRSRGSLLGPGPMGCIPSLGYRDGISGPCKRVVWMGALLHRGLGDSEVRREEGGL